MKHIVALMLSVLVLNAALAEDAQTVNFANKKLEKIVCGELGVKPPVSKTKLLELTDLVVQHEGEEAAGIDDLAGIEYATNLKKLFLYDNPIRDLSPLTKLKNLEGMQLSGKYIEDISPLAKLKNLEWLDLWETQVTDISPLTELKNLEYLTLSRNKISDISPLSELLNLRHLDISYNQVHDIFAVSALKNLESLAVSHNQISDISALSGLSSLRMLHLSSNQIRDISPLVRLTNLEALNIEDNPLNEEAYKVHFPKMLKLNPDLYVTADRDLKPGITKAHLTFYLTTSSLLVLVGLLVMLLSRKTMPRVERTDIARNVNNNNSTNQRKRISTLALGSLGFSIPAHVLVGICIFIVWAVDVYPVGQMGGFSLTVQAFWVAVFAFGSSVAGLIMGVLSVFEINRSQSVLIGKKQACCGVLLSLVALAFCIISFGYLR